MKIDLCRVTVETPRGEVAGVVLSQSLFQGHDQRRKGSGLITSTFLMKQIEKIVQSGKGRQLPVPPHITHCAGLRGRVREPNPRSLATKNPLVRCVQNASTCLLPDILLCTDSILLVSISFFCQLLQPAHTMFDG